MICHILYNLYMNAICSSTLKFIISSTLSLFHKQNITFRLIFYLFYRFFSVFHAVFVILFYNTEYEWVRGKKILKNRTMTKKMIFSNLFCFCYFFLRKSHFYYYYTSFRDSYCRAICIRQCSASVTRNKEKHFTEE